MKRFTDTAKWAREWYQELPCRLKCFWQFLCDNADAAGVWEPNFRLASFQIGESISEADVALFGDRVEKLPSGKFHIKSFVEFQYGKVSEACKAHIPVIRALKKHSLSIAYPKAIHSLKEEEEETEEEDIPLTSGFEEFWQAYPKKRAKGDAERVWALLKLAKKLPELLTAVRKAKVSDDWTREGGRFVPHPASWLNNRGWEDHHEPLPEAEPAKVGDPEGWREWLASLPQKPAYQAFQYATPFLKDDFREFRKGKA